MFFKVVRKILGSVLIVADKLTTPKPIMRDITQQQKLDGITAKFTLYNYEGCPFCIKVRRVIKKLALKIDIVDATDATYRQTLLEEGGKVQVPCLCIKKDDGSLEWMYESDIIINYLEGIAN